MTVLYPKWREARLQSTANAALDGSGTTGVYAVLVDTGVYAYNPAHEFYSSLSGLAPVAEQELTGKTFVNGVFNHADVTWPSVPSGVTYEAIVVFIKNAGGSGTWRLVEYVDNASLTNVPVTSNSGNITWDVNASGNFAW